MREKWSKIQNDFAYAVSPIQPTVTSPVGWILTWEVHVLATVILTGRSP